MNTLTQTPPIASAHHGLIVEGARDMTPMVIGVVPFALAIGAAIGTSSVPLGAGLLSGPLILAGSAQILTLEMLDSGAPALVVILSAVLVNARILLYGAALAPWFADQPLRRRLLLAIPVIDQTHFVCGARFTRGDLDSTGRVLYYIGAAGWLVSAWLGAQLAAVLLGARLPDAMALEVAAPLALVGLLASSVDGRAAAAAATTGFVIAVACVGLPLHSSILIAIVAGIAVGRLLRRSGADR